MVINAITKFCKYAVIPLLLGFPVAIIAYRLDLWSMGVSFKIIQYTGFISMAVLVIALLVAIFALVKKQKDVATTCGIVTVLLALPVVGLSMQAAKAKSLPFIHQVITDTVKLPEFDSIIALRG
jgi:apolipoprotein N-acyltransferase